VPGVLCRLKVGHVKTVCVLAGGYVFFAEVCAPLDLRTCSFCLLLFSPQQPWLLRDAITSPCTQFIRGCCFQEMPLKKLVGISIAVAGMCWYR
jgi:hypothetical protein